ncbi:MAG TPA: laccase domain-containing protein [Acidimicrobiales bacterium]|nr:laccase domain-containing protein [Acidimicrobiales bacterium]
MGPATGVRHLDDGRVARWTFTDRHHGDLRVDGDPDDLAARRAGVAPTPWTWLRQVHGAEVVVARHPGDGAGTAADAVATVTTGATVAVHTADCAPVVLVAPTGAVAVAHAGWRGLTEGVLEEAVAALRDLTGDHRVEAALGPCVHPECYAFGADDLARVVDRFGPAVASRTADGDPALDLPAAVRAALGAVDVAVDDHEGGCTACGDRWWSHRARADAARQAAVAWIEPDTFEGEP